MSQTLEDLYKSLKAVRQYLIKIGPNRRQGNILIHKLKEAGNLYDKYTSLIHTLSIDITEGKLSSADAELVNKLSSNIEILYSEIEQLCSEGNSSDCGVNTSTKMESFNLKTALSLLPQMTDEESNTKSLIDNIEYYSSVLKSNDCKSELIKFVLKSRLSQSAKLKLNSNYSNVEDLIKDMRKELLPQKSAASIQDKLHRIRQNDLTIEDYGKKISEMFVELTISQSEGNTESFNFLKNVNEKFAIKKFADGLRNRRLSTVIAARNYKSLKDAIQAAKEEEPEGSSTSGDVMGMYQNDSEPYLFSRRGQNQRGMRSGYTRIFSNQAYRTQNTRGRAYRGHSFPPQATTTRRPWQPRGRYSNYYNRRGNQWISDDRIRVVDTEQSDNDESVNCSTDNKFFRE